MQLALHSITRLTTVAHHRLPLPCTCSASITYSVEAELVLPGILHSNLRAGASFPVLHTYKKGSKARPLHASRVREVLSWCCFKRGELKLSVDAPTSRVYAGDTLQVTVQVRHSLERAACMLPSSY